MGGNIVFRDNEIATSTAIFLLTEHEKKKSPRLSCPPKFWAVFRRWAVAFVSRKRALSTSPTVLLALKRPVFKVARKGEERMYEIYTTRPHLEILIVVGLCPRARSTPRAVKEEKRDTISFRPAGRPTEPVPLS